MTLIEGNVLELDCKHWGEKSKTSLSTASNL